MSTYREYVEKVRDAHSVVDLLTDRYGATVENKMVLCPFHADSNPSCSVSEEFYHCFACHAKGDVFHLVQRLDGCSFSEAVQRMAEWAGLPSFHPPKAEQEAALTERELSDITDLAATYYEERLSYHRDARDYLLETRRLPPAVIDGARLGWADGGLTADLWEKGVHYDGLVQAGLATGQTRNASTWSSEANVRDLFFDRVMFPALRHHRATFLVGRAWGDGMPKYLNQRGQPAPLYNADALSADYAIAVEGAPDTLSLVAWEFPTVGLLGTLNTSVLAQLRRPKRMYLCLDADSAGRSGALALAAALGPLRTRVVALPDGLDPNDFYRSQPRSAFLGLLEGAQEPVTHVLSRLPVYSAMDPATLDAAFAPVFGIWTGCSAMEVQAYLDGPVKRWAEGKRVVVAAVAASWAQWQQQPLRCPGCGTFLVRRDH